MKNKMEHAIQMAPTFPHSWRDLYQDKRASRVCSLPLVAKFISDEFSAIRLETDGLREHDFRENHVGALENQTDLSQVTEKRLVRALYNENCQKPGALGIVLDYEVPLQADLAHGHGEIDLLCLKEDKLLVVEAKSPKDRGSLLKAVLQAYTYTRLVNERKIGLSRCYRLEETKVPLKPVVLAGSWTIRYRLQGKDAPLRDIVRRLNLDLRERSIESMTFYGWDYPEYPLDRLLELRDNRVRFARNHVPSIECLDDLLGIPLD